MKNTFNNIIQKFNEFNVLIEDVLNMLPNTPKNYKLKLKVEAAYKTLTRALQMHEDLITDIVPPVNIPTTDYPKEFIDTWNIYKDYLIEQFGIRMRSRMQIYRLELLFQYSNNDFKLATRWLKYYMAAGSSNIFPVNEQKLIQDEQSKKAGFKLPKATN